MVYFIILAGAVIRVLSHFEIVPHLPNFAPIAAMALFGGVYLSKKHSLIIPIGAMLVADIFIGFYSPWVMASVYLSFILTALIGWYVKKNKNFANVIGGALLGSIVFFLVTNFAVWAAPHSVEMYPNNLQGLLQSYIMGLPFFRNTIAGDLFYTSAMFGLMEMVIFLVNGRVNARIKRVAGKRI